CDLAFFIFDEAKCLAAISTFGEEIDLTLGQPLPFFAARTLLRHQLVAFAGYRQYSIWIRLILPDVSIKNRRVNLYRGTGGNQIRYVKLCDAERNCSRISIVAIRQNDYG